MRLYHSMFFVFASLLVREHGLQWVCEDVDGLEKIYEGGVN
jgi:hypothetical protein